MEDLDRALLLYIGWKWSPSPSLDEARILNHFGNEKGAELVDMARLILGELDSIKPSWERHSLTEAAEWAVEKVALAHPELDAETLQALNWIYAWGYK
jgi:hypothetical protein